ncbi:Sodium/hydrogen exchanger 8 [Durusdinium trenchii]|uniref:Sodium/hydrogen exchanger 8 n=1 Tax=Durusdinium trenchii TaxID=1381693 RepID=A0ABP0NBM8_9DINO
MVTASAIAASILEDYALEKISSTGRVHLAGEIISDGGSFPCLKLWQPEGYSDGRFRAEVLEIPSATCLDRSAKIEWQTAEPCPEAGSFGICWNLQVLDKEGVFCCDQWSCFIHQPNLIAPQGSCKEPPFHVLELYAGGIGGWSAAWTFLQDHAHIGHETIAVEQDLSACIAFAMNHNAAVMNGLGKLHCDDLTMLPKPVILQAHIEQSGWWSAVAKWGVDIMSISASCKPWSGAAAQPGLFAFEGESFAVATQLTKIFRPALVFLEQVYGFNQHPHKPIIVALLKMAGYIIRWEKIVDAADQSAVHRFRWLAIAVRFHDMTIVRKPFVPWKKIQCTPTSIDAIVQWDPAQLNSLKISEEAFQKACQWQFLPPAKRCFARQFSEAKVIATRCNQGNETVDTFMALYTSQHGLSDQVLRTKGYMAHFVQVPTPEEKIEGKAGTPRWWHPFEACMLHICYKRCFIVNDRAQAWIHVGNQISVPHALLVIVNGLNLVLSGPAELDLHALFGLLHKSHMQANRVLSVAFDEGTLFRDRRFDGIELDNIDVRPLLRSVMQQQGVRYSGPVYIVFEGRVLKHATRIADIVTTPVDRHFPRTLTITAEDLFGVAFKHTHKTKVSNALAGTLLEGGFAIQWVSKTMELLGTKVDHKDLTAVAGIPAGPKHLSAILELCHSRQIDVPAQGTKDHHPNQSSKQTKQRRLQAQPDPTQYRIAAGYFLNEDNTECEQIVDPLLTCTLSVPCEDPQGRSVILACNLVQFGAKKVSIIKSSKTVAMEASKTVAFAMYKEDWKQDAWTQLLQNTFQVAKAQMKDDVILSCWGRSFRADNKAVQPHQAHSIQIHCLIKSSELQAVLAGSGFNYLFATPKDEQGRPDTGYRILWLTADWAYANTLAARLSNHLGLVKGKKTLGLRFAADMFEEAWKIANPSAPIPPLDRERGWQGRRLMGILTFNGSPILVRLVPPKNSPAYSPIVAGPRPSGTTMLPQSNGAVDGLQINDPWAKWNPSTQGAPAPTTGQSLTRQPQGPMEARFVDQDTKIANLEQTVQRLAEDHQKQTSATSQQLQLISNKQDSVEKQFQTLRSEVEQSVEKSIASHLQDTNRGIEELKKMFLASHKRPRQPGGSDMDQD